MPSECAAVGCSEKLTKEFSFHAFRFRKEKKNEARKRQWQVAMNRWDLATKKWEPKHHDVLCSKHFEKKKKCFTDCTLLSIQFGLKYMSTLQPIWKKFQFESPRMKLRRPLSFHLSRALLGAWRFGLFRCVYSSFHNRLDLIREPACFIIFSQFICVCFIIRIDENVLLVLVQ